MVNTLASDIYPSTTYIDPLLFITYLKTNDSPSIAIQVRNDWLLSLYVEKLNQEIIDDIEEFKEHKSLINNIFWNVRTHGWCVVQFYKNDVVKVFSSLEFKEWITEVDPKTNKKIRLGVKVKWNDELGNNWDDSLYFDEYLNENKEIEGKAYLFKWQDGDGQPLPNNPSMSAFALADVSMGILSLAIQIRQIISTMSFGAVNPYFYFLKYGESITPTQRTNLIKQMSLVGVSRALGAKGSSLDDIRPIENASVVNSIIAMKEFMGFYAGATLLPKSFYAGEREKGGLGDSGENQDEIDIAKKKEFILQHFISGLEEIFTEQFSLPFPNLYNYYSNLAEENKQKKQIELEKKNELIQNGQKTQGINKE